MDNGPGPCEDKTLRDVSVPSLAKWDRLTETLGTRARTTSTTHLAVL